MAILKNDLLNKLRAYASTPDDETIQYKEKIKQTLLKCPELLYALHEEELEEETALRLDYELIEQGMKYEY